jgi:hypothetical protein
MDSKTPMAIMKEFFGYKQGQSMQDFVKEIKELSPEEKRELVELAAKELGVEIKEV